MKKRPKTALLQDHAGATRLALPQRGKLGAQVIALALALVTFAVFWPVRQNDFINFDDPDYVTQNAHVQRGITWANLLWAFRTTEASNWHPVTWLSHMADWEIFGPRAGGHHLMSVLLHVANTLLLFFLLKRMTGAQWPAAFVAALFAVHPLHVESVAWISERKDVLSALFFFLATWSYVEYTLKRAQFGPSRRGGKSYSEQPTARPRPVHSLHSLTQWQLRAAYFYLLSLLLFAFGLTSKPMIVTLPFILLLLDYWPLQRMEVTNRHATLKSLVYLLLEKIPFLVLSALGGAITLVSQTKSGAVATGISLSLRMGNAVISYTRYIGKMIWPGNLSVFYPYPPVWPANKLIVAAAFLLLVSSAVVALRRNRPYLLVGWLWFLGMLLPVIGLIQIGGQSMADRYTYLPLIGLFIMLVWGVRAAFRESILVSKIIVTAGAFALAGLGYLARSQSEFWQNSETLFRHAIETTKNNYVAYNYLGLCSSGDKAIENFVTALQINPSYGAAHNNLGTELAMQGKIKAAQVEFEEAIKWQPNMADAHANLGMAFAAEKQWDKAVKEYQQSLHLKPADPQVHANLGHALMRQGQLREAIEHFLEALRLGSTDPEIHFQVGFLLAKQGHVQEAKAWYTEALRMKPDYLPAQKELNVLNAAGEK